MKTFQEQTVNNYCLNHCLHSALVFYTLYIMFILYFAFFDKTSMRFLNCELTICKNTCARIEYQ